MKTQEKKSNKNTSLDNKQKNTSKTNTVGQRKNNEKQNLEFVDNRIENTTQMKLQNIVDLKSQSSVIQKMGWTWNGNKWVPDSFTRKQPPNFRGGLVGARFIDSFGGEEEKSPHEKFIEMMDTVYKNQLQCWGDEINKKEAIKIFNMHDDILNSGQHHGVRHVKLRTLRNDVERNM